MSTNPLKEFIEEIGDERCAAICGVKVRTASSWRRGERSPRPPMARRLVAASGGKLSLEKLYQEPGPCASAEQAGGKPK
jgi:hypothetical protein